MDARPYSIAGHRIDVVAPSGVTDAIAHLLRYHADAAAPAPSALVRLDLADGEAAPACTLEHTDAGMRTSVWTIPAASSAWSPERVYYRALFAILARVLASLDVVRLHGALLAEERLGGVLLLGDRGAGKSSTSAAWVHEGGAVATDDTVLVGADGRVYGLHRELHVDPDLASRLPGLPGLSTAVEYLPGSHRLAYDWCADFPDRRAARVDPVAHVVASRVDAGASTTLRPLSDEELRDLIATAIEAEKENALISAAARDAAVTLLAGAHGWDATWGADVWTRPGKHIGAILKASRARAPSGAG
jgi:hypothetical protein